MACGQGWTPWRRHFQEEQRRIDPPSPPARQDWLAVAAGLAIIGGFALCLAVIGLLDGMAR